MAKKKKSIIHTVEVPKIHGETISVYQYLNHLEYQTGKRYKTVKRARKKLEPPEQLHNRDKIELIK